MIFENAIGNFNDKEILYLLTTWKTKQKTMLRKITLLTALLFLVQMSVKAQSPVLDSLFGSNAILNSTPAQSGGGGLLLLQPDGKIILGGHHYTAGFGSAFIDLTRFDICGNLDTTFGVGGVASVHFDNINTLANMKLQSDGKILCVGIQAPSTAGSQQMAYVARLNPNGTPDSTFNDSGSYSRSFDGISSGEFSGVDILPDGRILATGTCRANINGGQYAYAAMRFMPDGKVDTTFSGGGLYLRRNVTNPIYNTSGHLLSGGKTIMATTIDNNGHVLLQVIRIDSNGVLDSTFATNGVYDDGKTYFTTAGSFAAIDDNSNIIITAQNNGGASTVFWLTSNGALETAFGTGGYVSIDPSIFFIPYRATILQNGKVALMGYSSLGSSGDGIMLLNSKGIDSTFGTNGILSMGFQSFSLGIRGVLELPHNKLMMGNATTTHNAVKFTPQSNVPHITNNSGVLSSTGTGTFQWFLNTTPISGATQSTLNVPGDGSYTVMITDVDGCTYLSDSLVVTGSGVEEMPEEIVSVFPNPATDHLNIRSSSPVRTIAVVNGLGETVMVTNRVVESLDLGMLTNGAYLVTIQLENNTIVTKKITIVK
jgi:uncharacterized delta-60 repeat protein